MEFTQHYTLLRVENVPGTSERKGRFSLQSELQNQRNQVGKISE